MKELVTPMKFNWRKATRTTFQLAGLLGLFIGALTFVVGFFRGRLTTVGIGGGIMLLSLYVLIGFSNNTD